MKYLFLILSLFAFSVNADTMTAPAKLTWTVPTTYANTEKTPLPAGDIAGYTLKWGTAPGIYAAENKITIAPTATSYDFSTSLTAPAGTEIDIYFVISVTTKNGRYSAPSNEVSKKFVIPNNSPPAAPKLTVQ